MTAPTGRAWIELDRNALGYNVTALQALLPQSCELMAALKADAYGHGSILMANELCNLGINSFCVASIAEGIKLRKNQIKGDILILGYTSPEDFPLLIKYDLIQTIVDHDHARDLNNYGWKIRVHVGIDTGMHRLGERWENIDLITEIFLMKNLQIEAMFSHLCSYNTENAIHKAFSEEQVNAFFHVIEELKKRGISCPKTHLMSSYALFNYFNIPGNYCRAGIALYGMLNTKADTENCYPRLKPVLSLKARVATVKPISAGENVGYGLAFIAKKDMKIATLAIGYVDGIPRALSNGVGKVLINGIKAPIVGTVCMDQTLVDVTNIPDVKPSDIAIIIGKSEDKEITAWDIADEAGTITGEILARLGSRLERILV